jgi:hypothetical protein
MCNITDNFMEEALFHHQLKMEYEHRMWYEWIEDKEKEEKEYLTQAQQYFNDLEQMEAEQSAMIEDYSYGK